MSMKMLTLLQFTEAFSAYFFVTVMLPAFVLRKKVKTERLAVRFLLYFTVGNFFVINLVYFLQLIKLSYRITLILFTLIPVLLGWRTVRQIAVKEKIALFLQTVLRMARGQMGLKTLLLWITRWGAVKLDSVMHWIRKNILCKFIDWVLTLGLTAILFWQYGQNLLINYGYGASDIIVHNYWINYMSKNQIFVAGVYPYGFHCVLYYIHEVFGIDTYVLLRVFWLVQVVMLHYVLLAFLKACCKSRFAAYIGVGLYACASCFHEYTYSRYYSSLPQEFGILFILPAIYFAFAFFQKNLDKKKANEFLAGFAMSFSMTLTVHFYGTMIAGLFCAGIAVGYAFRFFTKKYFGRVIATFLISIVIAILPMGVAFAMGTPLQGSLGWGLNVISGAGSEKKTEETKTVEPQKTQTIPVETQVIDGEIGEQPQEIIIDEIEDSHSFSIEPIVQKVKEKLVDVVGKISKSMDDFVFSRNSQYARNSVYLCMAIMFFFALLFFCMKRADYAAMLVSIVVFMILMCILLTSAKLGIPKLMDENRSRVYFAYMLPLLWSLSIDAIFYFLFGKENGKESKIGKALRRVLWPSLSLVAVFAVAYFVISNNLLRKPLNVRGLQTNEAVTCLTNIIHDNKDQMWTIVSANDELRMGEDHGYHYETIDLLRSMEKIGGLNQITIPTPMVYIFIEKVPLDYSKKYAGSGQRISEEGAKMTLPYSTGISIYQAENRFVIMSRMYYWAQAFMKKYPNEMKVYFENDKFLCYRIEQNPYRLFNFSIDYGYNIDSTEVK